MDTRQNTREAPRNRGAKKQSGPKNSQALQADAAECANLMFAAGPSSATAARDGGGGHSEGGEDRERNEGEGGGRAEAHRAACLAQQHAMLGDDA